MCGWMRIANTLSLWDTNCNNMDLSFFLFFGMDSYYILYPQSNPQNPYWNVLLCNNL